MSEKKTILIVEDEADLLTFYSALLTDHGYEPITAEDGLACMDMVRKHKPDLITLDITMPRQSGVKTYRQLKDDPDFMDIPVIIITAVGDNMKSFLDGRRQVPEPEGFMPKPIDKGKLLELIGKLLSN